MPETGKKGLRKGEIAYMLAMVFGLMIGILIKRIRIGIFLGLLLCVLIGLSTVYRFTRKIK